MLVKVLSFRPKIIKKDSNAKIGLVGFWRKQNYVFLILYLDKLSTIGLPKCKLGVVQKLSISGLNKWRQVIWYMDSGIRSKLWG